MKLKKVPPGQKGLAKLPTSVRNKMGYMKEGGRVSRVLKRGKKKAERIHEREAKKESKGKKVAVAGTKRVTTAAEPRMLTSRRKTVKVYQKERDVTNKTDVKAAKIEGKQATKTPKRTKVKPPKIKKNTPRPPRGRGRRPDKPGKGGVKKVIQNIKKIAQNKKKGCFGRGDC